MKFSYINRSDGNEFEVGNRQHSVEQFTGNNKWPCVSVCVSVCSYAL